MLDFSVFDYLLDSVFVVGPDGRVVYCNEVGANFCQTSVKRASGKTNLSDFISFTEPGLLPFTPQSHGRTSPSTLIETAYKLVKADKSGKVQLTVRPVDDKHWVFFLHDVSLEETLASKYRSELRKTEEYARNLEKLVEARTIELRSVNRTLNAILDSLGQGFFTFNSLGDCGDVFTKACEEILQGTPRQRKAWEVLAVPEAERSQFQKWMETAFNEYLPFEDVKGLGPSLFPHSQQKHVVLDYFPIRRESREISDIVVVATDKTTEHDAQVALEAERQYASMIVKYLKNKDQFLQFLMSVKTSVQTLLDLANKDMGKEEVSESFRLLHTLEGEAGTFSLRELRQLARDSQHIMEPFKGEKLPAEVRAKYLQSIYHLQTQFGRYLSENESIIRVPRENEGRTVELPLKLLQDFAQQLPPTMREKLSDLVLKVTVESRLKYFDSLVQSVAERLGKKVKPMIIEGGNIRIFPDPYQRFFSSLVHAFRNAVDHGLENPADREWAGKDPAGQIRVQVAENGTGLRFVISDDGRGIDPASIREKLKAKFPHYDFSQQTDEEVIQNVSLPGFSSREEVGEFSGRGVGLDALGEEVLSMGGTINLKSTVGVGTTIEIFIPSLGHESGLRRSA